jgi:hypothetical protein
MRMANRAGQRIGGIGGGCAGQIQQPDDHVLDLILGRLALPDYGLFDLQSGVFRDW